MKRVQTDRPSLESGGTSKGKRKNPQPKLKFFSPRIQAKLLSRLEERLARDGFSYKAEVLRVLCTLYGQGRMSRKFGAQMKAMLAEWRAQEEPESTATIQRVVVRFPPVDYDRALTRWKIEAGEEANANDLFKFLVWTYAMRKLSLGISSVERRIEAIS